MGLTFVGARLISYPGLRWRSWTGMGQDEHCMYDEEEKRAAVDYCLEHEKALRGPDALWGTPAGGCLRSRSTSSRLTSEKIP